MAHLLFATFVLGQLKITTPGQPAQLGPAGLLDPPIPEAVDAGAPAPLVGPDAGAVTGADAGAMGADAGTVGAADAGAGLGANESEALREARAAAALAAEEASQAQQVAAVASQRAAEAAAKLADLSKGPTAPAASPPQPTGWTGTAHLSLIAFTGNAQSLSLSAGANASKFFRDGWILSFGGQAKYGEAALTVGTPVEVTALQADGFLRGDKAFARSATVYVLGGLDTDHIDSLELREYGEPGVSIYWFDRKRGDLETLFLRTDVGMRYSNERRFQYYPNALDLGDVAFLGPRFGAAFHVAVTKEIAFVQEGEILRDMLSPRVMVNTNTKLLAHLIKQFSLTVSFLVNYDSSPPLNRLPTDTALTVGVDMTF